MKKNDIELDGWQNKKSYLGCKTENGFVKYFGIFNNGMCSFEFHVNEQKSGRYRFRGGVSALDKRGNKIKTHKRGSDKEEIVFSSINLHDASDSIIKTEVARKVADMFAKHYNIIVFDIKRKASPNTISLAEAAITVADQFVAIRHERASVNNRKRYVQRIIRTCNLFPAIPMYELTKTECKAVIQSNNIDNSEVITELYEFWNYCISRRVCIGSNPIKKPTKHNKSLGTREGNKLRRRTILSMEQQTHFYDILEAELSGASVAVALLASDISTKTIENLVWKDICFFADDYAVVLLYDPKRAGATHNLSRPIFPRAAQILYKYYESLKKRYDKIELGNMPVCAGKNDPKVTLKSSRITDEATRIVRSVIENTDPIAVAKKLEPDIAAVKTVLRNTYKNNLISVCNLDVNSLVYKYLVGERFANDVSLDHYATFSCKPGWDFIRTIFSPLAKMRENDAIEDYDDNDGRHIFCVPTNNLEFAKILLVGTVDSRRRVSIYIKHGGDGTVKTRKAKVKKKDSEKKWKETMEGVQIEFLI